MASRFLSSAQTFLPCILPSSTSCSSSASIKLNATRKLTLCCKACSDEQCPGPIITKRSMSLSFITSFVLSLGGKGKGYFGANAAILEADDDEELLERVKKDRKKRIERQGIINSSGKETGYLQDAVYKLSKVGQAIENNDLSTASSVLGNNSEAGWLQKAKLAFDKLTSSPEEKTEVDAFNSSLASLISAVGKNDIESSKVAFVASASAFEKWTALTGLGQQLKGL